MPAPALPYVASGQLKALAVTSAARDPRFPQVPTAEESGVPNFQVSNWQGLFAPHGTPKEIVETIAAAVAKAMQEPETRKRLQAIGFDARGDGPPVAAEQVRVNTAKWSEVVSKAGIKVKP
jgi:tripartite-type tricarboxylate transporter receptor subunit TctC